MQVSLPHYMLKVDHPRSPRFGPLDPYSYPECNRTVRCSPKVSTTTTQSPEHQLAAAMSGYPLDALSQRNADRQRASHTPMSKHLNNTMPILAPRAATRPQGACNAHSAPPRAHCDLYRLLDPCHAREATQALRFRRLTKSPILGRSGRHMGCATIEYFSTKSNEIERLLNSLTSTTHARVAPLLKRFTQPLNHG